MWETWVQSLGWEDPLEKEMATCSSILAWKIPWSEEPAGLQVCRFPKSQTWLSDLTFTFNFIKKIFWSKLTTFTILDLQVKFCCVILVVVLRFIVPTVSYTSFLQVCCAAWDCIRISQHCLSFPCVVLVWRTFSLTCVVDRTEHRCCFCCKPSSMC